MINIPINHDPKHNCFDDLIAVIAKNESRDYQLMLSNAWTFCFRENCKTIGDSIQYSPSSDLFLLQKYHGIEATYSNTFNIKSLNQKNTYVAAYIDTFKCPWDKNYMKYHNYGHTIIVNDMDVKYETIHVADPFYGKYEKLKFKDFIQAYCGSCYISIKDDFKRIDDIFILEYIVEFLRSITSQQIPQINMFMQKMACINIDVELNNVLNIWHSSLAINLNKISLDRLRYSTMLFYLLQKTGLPLTECIKELEQVSSLWVLVRNLVIKLFMMKEDKMIKNIVRLLEEVENREENICSKLIYIISQHICERKNNL